ncbi:hypothetical protein QFZ75_002777 [Streptomyces sp. V3I8]|jgi:hypothetical protein|uniref:nuclear transport factor 2 family protein n=1 Tax=Streptomyces sp. V3I8 TaxID=3042279 RepID=UPI00278597D2|nr:nuclear transport factor 2 family protein [Streptomyces sp. V3I8]MDQ1036361.1 hypothetical protein [Streptomyces sp. V3I8]
MDGAKDDAADDVRQAIAGELRLMDPRVRSSRELAGRLLDPEFVEVGGSGRRWTYAAMLDGLAGHPGSSPDGPRYEPSDISGVLLAPGLVHLTFETLLDGVRTRHSSIWRRRDGPAGGGDEGGGWRMYYHQATRVPPGAE